MDTIEISLNSLDETEKFGQLIGSLALAGDVICLDGDLGAGKTTLTQAIARGLDVPSSSYVTSPSFAIMHEYEGRINMYHMDFYRLDDEMEVEDLGFPEYFYKDGLTVIEWPERAGELLPVDRLDIKLTLVDEYSRKARCCSSPIYKRYVEAFNQTFASP